ncbi:MAG: pseudouridine synthase [Acidobacteria bacterium]|nr:pseudouridine synthase [Acidobacteriota bacterium]MBV9474548.1 pseudouridine synthase [Acidobacteriota bacterium]
MELERLQKIIAHAGFASRREAETMIREGRVTVNGRVVTELGSRADAAHDHIKVDGKLITRAETHRYILLYKPREVMSTVTDPEGRKTAVDLVKGVRERIYPVGRLDYQSEGLLLLTNDGDLAYKVSHPKHGSVKTYHVKVRGVPDERIIGKLERGITIEGKRTVPCEIARMKTTGRGEDEGNSWYEVKLREGRNQQIRKMFKAVGHPVSKLRRVAIGPIADPKLAAGDWRELTKSEVKMLATMQEMPKPKPRRTAAHPSKKKTTAPAKRGASPRAKTHATARPAAGASRGKSAKPAHKSAAHKSAQPAGRMPVRKSSSRKSGGGRGTAAPARRERG